MYFLHRIRSNHFQIKQIKFSSLKKCMKFEFSDIRIFGVVICNEREKKLFKFEKIVVVADPSHWNIQTTLTLEKLSVDQEADTRKKRRKKKRYRNCA